MAEAMITLSIVPHEAQRAIYEAVRDRGYHQGWTAQQYAARNVAKLVEEVAEMGAHYQLPYGAAGNVEMSLQLAGMDARAAFDNNTWIGAEPLDLASAIAELADVQVVVFNIAETLAQLLGTDVDIVMLALAKAGADVTRGTRVPQKP